MPIDLGLVHTLTLSYIPSHADDAKTSTTQLPNEYLLSMTDGTDEIDGPFSRLLRALKPKLSVDKTTWFNDTVKYNAKSSVYEFCEPDYLIAFSTTPG